ERYAVVALDRYAHWTQQHIAKAIGCGQQTVSYILKKHKEHGTVEDLTRSGRPNQIDISDEQQNPITSVIAEHRQYTSGQIREELNMVVSARTVRRYRKMLRYRPV